MKPVAIGKPESNGEGVNADIGVKYLHETKSCTLEIVHLCNLAQLHSFNRFCHNAQLFRCDTRLVLLAQASACIYCTDDRAKGPQDQRLKM